MVQPLIERACHWCGNPLPADTPAIYCNRGHRNRQNEWRRRQRDVQIQRCPHPEKAVFPTRGLAIDGARRNGAHYYLCCCGVYHLTSKKPWCK